MKIVVSMSCSRTVTGGLSIGGGVLLVLNITDSV